MGAENVDPGNIVVGVRDRLRTAATIDQHQDSSSKT